MERTDHDLPLLIVRLRLVGLLFLSELLLLQSLLPLSLPMPHCPLSLQLYSLLLYLLGPEPTGLKAILLEFLVTRDLPQRFRALFRINGFWDNIRFFSSDNWCLQRLNTFLTDDRRCLLNQRDTFNLLRNYLGDDILLFVDYDYVGLFIHGHGKELLFVDWLPFFLDVVVGMG